MRPGGKRGRIVQALKPLRPPASFLSRAQVREITAQGVDTPWAVVPSAASGIIMARLLMAPDCAASAAGDGARTRLRLSLETERYSLIGRSDQRGGRYQRGDRRDSTRYFALLWG